MHYVMKCGVYLAYYCLYISGMAVANFTQITPISLCCDIPKERMLFSGLFPVNDYTPFRSIDYERNRDHYRPRPVDDLSS